MKKNVFFLSLLLIFSTFAFSQETAIVGGGSSVAKNEIEATEFASRVQFAMSNPEYVVTAGDIYLLAFNAGSQAVSYTIPVDSSYKIRVANLAVIDGKGKTFVELKKEVENIVVKNFAMSGVQFVLEKPASFKIKITGEVSNTVEKSAWSLSRVSSLIGGELTGYASKRKVTIISENGNRTEIDLFKARREGDFSQNPYLRPGDTIEIHRMKRRVTINGAVERPGTYELEDGENLKSLVEYYGNGLAPLADTRRMEIYRITNEEAKSGEKFYIVQKDIDEDYKLECYDSVFISSYSNLSPVMFMEGAVATDTSGAGVASTNKVTLHFNHGENYANFIRSYASMFHSVADTENAYIIREGKIIPINLNLALYDVEYRSDLTVQEYDVLKVPFRQFFVTVAGAVRNPGRFPYIPDRTSDYYVGLAGGFDPTKNKSKSLDIIDVNGNKLSDSAVIIPEATITAATNSPLYYFNQYAPVITTVLSIVASTLSIMAATGAF